MAFGKVIAITLAVALTATQAGAVTQQDILETYANVALAKYEDALSTAQQLDVAVDALITNPSDEMLEIAREKWREARVPYQQTEVYRFGNAIVDEWEGRVNAWPLDEGLIDYVDASYGDESDTNPYYTANLIGGTPEIDGATTIEITPELLQETLQEAGEIEANVATGYHAIEFLLWGQDLNGTGAGAGNRPSTDFDPDNCTGGNCERRIQYLKAAVELLKADLQEMVGNWQEGGAARQAVTLPAIFTGMGSLSYGELAGERMKLGLLLHDPEEEHDCFSDNTHNSHYYDQVGIQNAYNGTYIRVDGSVIEGASVADMLAEADPALAQELQAKLDKTTDAMKAMKQRAETTEAYDQMIGQGNAEGNAVIQAVIDALVDQTRSIERAVVALGLGDITVEGSDSLDSPDAVFE